MTKRKSKSTKSTVKAAAAKRSVTKSSAAAEHNFHKMVHAPDKDRLEGDALPAEEEHILRCLGAAVIMQWNNIPKKLQRELFDNAGAMGDLLGTKDLRGKVARFLHKPRMMSNEGRSAKAAL